MSWIVTQIGIRGIRGILDRGGDFTPAQERSARSIAIYAPNACGKSSYADAIEYFFSQEGSVGHLGADGERGGKPAIPHVLAKERGIEPQVSMMLVNLASGKSVEVNRSVKTDQSDDLPPELCPIVRAAPAHRILRQHDLGNFVVDMSPGARYAELSRWLGLTRLEQVLKHLASTSKALESRDLGREVEERVRDIARHTGNSVTEHDERAVLDWCEAETERHLGQSLVIDSPAGLKKAIRTLKRLQGRIILASAAAESYQAKLALEQIATGLVSQDGQLEICNTALSEAVAAERRTKRLLTTAKHSVFQEAWGAAQEVLETQITDQCPVCLTPWGRSRVGSQESALTTIIKSRNELARLATARNEQQKAARKFKMAIRELEAHLVKVSTKANKLSLSEIETRATELARAARTLSTANRFPSRVQDECEALLSRCRRFVTAKLHPALSNLQIVQVPATTTQVEATIEHFQILQDALIRLKELGREQEEYQNIKCSFNAIANVIREQTAALTNDVVAALQDDVRSIYQMIHPTEAAPNIHIVPDTESRTLKVRVDFSDRTLPAAGYLCESRINTLGLALFTSSVGLFNRRFPFLFLDDVVSSYDADHQSRIVNVIAERLSGFQVFLTTHDRRFYSMLESRLCDEGWLFECISGWDLEHGPKRKVSDQS